MKRTIKTEAIVLKKRALPNQDKIITLLTKELGKVAVFAKGIKKITSRRLPHVQTANLINCVLYKKDERYFLQETSLISGFSRIKNNQQKLEGLYKFFFVVERILPESQIETDIYNLVMKFLIELSKKENILLGDYLNKLLFDLGYIHEEKTEEELRQVIEGIIHDKMPELHI